MKNYAIFIENSVAPFRSALRRLLSFYFNGEWPISSYLWFHGLVLIEITCFWRKAGKGICLLFFLPAIGFGLLSAIRKRLNQSTPLIWKMGYSALAGQGYIRQESCPAAMFFGRLLFPCVYSTFLAARDLSASCFPAGLAVVRVIGRYIRDVPDRLTLYYLTELALFTIKAISAENRQRTYSYIIIETCTTVSTSKDYSLLDVKNIRENTMSEHYFYESVMQEDLGHGTKLRDVFGYEIPATM